MLPPKHQGLKESDLSNLNRKVVLISQHDVIREGFAWKEGNGPCFQRFRSLAVRKDEFIILSSLPSDCKNLEIDGKLHFVSVNDSSWI